MVMAACTSRRAASTAACLTCEHADTRMREGDADDQPCPWCHAENAVAGMDRANDRLVRALHGQSDPGTEA
jgi:hypothetical protein